MAQVGIHALVGLVVGERIYRRFGYRPTGRSLALGFLLGNIAPDLDAIAVAGALPFDPEVALRLHRSFSHSLVTAGMVLLVSLLLSLILQDRSLGRWGAGAALGMGIHILMDLVFWFTSVDLLWPASALGWAAPVDLWAWWETPLLVGRLLAASEFGAFGLYFAVLAARAQPEQQANAIRRMQNLSLWYGLILAVVSFVLPSEMVYRLLLLVPMGLVALPASLYLTLTMRGLFLPESARAYPQTQSLTPGPRGARPAGG